MKAENLYNSPDVAARIKARAKGRNMAIKDVLAACNLGSNTISHMLHGRSLAFDSLALIADTLDCSVDYLLGRTDVPEMGAFVLTYAARGGSVQTKIVSREEFAALQEQINGLPEETDEL